ncbi:hypothetical protein KAR28_02650 [Candidatus Parcubacteria bacterium]|nr:hypothetical protein [Candidatus Parcubacteria bacterium]
MKFNKQKKAIFLLMLSCLITGFLIFVYQYYWGTFFCIKGSQFHKDSILKKDIVTKQQTIINPSGTIYYFRDNFSTYVENSKSLESFEKLNNIEYADDTDSLALSKNSYNGNYSLLIKVNEETSKNNKNITIEKNFDQPIDLSRWSDFGFFTAWLDIEDRKGLLGIKLVIGDSNNDHREFKELPNLQLDVPDSFDNDDVFPNIEYPERESPVDEWTDFNLRQGWNFLLWRSEKGYFKDSGILDMSKISWFKIIFRISNEFREQEILIDDFRVQDGLQKQKNALNGVWYPPHGRPQYGIFDVDKYSGENYKLKLLNVRQTQYPSNGDHGRMILRHKTPLNFTMRTRFMLTNYNKTNNVNTWFRMMYDFDPVWDPGHDWFGVYISFEWKKFGLITVKPIERFFIQEQEPKKENIFESSINFNPRENILYELHLTVIGQKAKATIYEVRNDNLIIKGEVEYEFTRLRHKSDKRYPFALEITGDVKTIINEVEIIEL